MEQELEKVLNDTWVIESGENMKLHFRSHLISSFTESPMKISRRAWMLIDRDCVSVVSISRNHIIECNLWAFSNNLQFDFVARGDISSQSSGIFVALLEQASQLEPTSNPPVVSLESSKKYKWNSEHKLSGLFNVNFHLFQHMSHNEAWNQRNHHQEKWIVITLPLFENSLMMSCNVNIHQKLNEIMLNANTKQQGYSLRTFCFSKEKNAFLETGTMSCKPLNESGMVEIGSRMDWNVETVLSSRCRSEISAVSTLCHQ